MCALKIIDCHTHAYPEDVVANPREWAEARGEHHWADLVAPIDKPSIQGWSTLETMLHDMDQADVAQAVILGWYWQTEATCRWHNQVMSEWMSSSGGRLFGFASILPNENVIDQLESAKSLGFCGVGEMHIGVQDFEKTKTNWLAMAEWCAEEGWPINFHATETAGHQHPGSIPTPLQSFVQLAQAVPDLKMILAHWGGGLPFFEQNPRLRDSLRNVYYDTAASPLLYEPGIFRRMVDLVGEDKILFGSDYPLRIYPRKQKKPEMERFIEVIQRDSQLSEAQLDAIMGRNLQKLLAI